MTSESVQPILLLLSDHPGGNPTEFMIEQAFAHHDLDWTFHTVEVRPEGLEDAVRGIRAMGFLGAHISNPHKEAVLPLADRRTETAELVGAANTLLREGDDLIAENLEGRGLLAVLRGAIELADARVMILGAGRGARAAAVELGRAGVAELIVAGRDPARAEAIAELVAERFDRPTRHLPWQEELAVPEDVDAVVHATTLGREDPDAVVPIRLDSLRAGLILADMTANPPDTWLIRQAGERGCTTLDGLGMYVEQSAVAIELWTGTSPDRAVMRDAIEEFLEV